MDRLDFLLPEFTRLAWVSDRARDVWEPRIHRISSAWAALTWRSVALGLRECALVDIRPATIARASRHWSAHGLSWLALEPMPMPGAPPSTDRPLVRIAVGSAVAIRRMKASRQRADHDAIGELLGFPPCCRAFFRHVWVERRLTDTTWSMAANTRSDTTGGVIEVNGPAPANILHRWLGVRAIQHLPCRFDCAPSALLGRRYLAALGEIGRRREAAWIEEMLSWPVEWSALHGIAEIRSPIVKIVTQTDATPGKQTVRWPGTAYPSEGAIGIRFPYRTRAENDRAAVEPTRRPRLAALRRNAWYHTDNDFSSLRTMALAHKPIVALARQQLAGRSGAVIDLGCGNGVLVQAVCDRRKDLIPHGVDAKGESIRHARLLQPRFAANFVEANIFGAGDWLASHHAALVIMMAGRLVEVSRETAEALLALLSANAQRVLVYVHPGWRMGLAEIAVRIPLRLEIATGDVGILAAPAQPRTVRRA